MDNSHILGFFKDFSPEKVEENNKLKKGQIHEKMTFLGKKTRFFGPSPRDPLITAGNFSGRKSVFFN